MTQHPRLVTIRSVPRVAPPLPCNTLLIRGATPHPIRKRQTPPAPLSRPFWIGRIGTYTMGRVFGVFFQHHRRGGLHFVKFGRLNLQWSIAKR